MPQSAREEILAENIRVHSIEAPLFKEYHQEIFNAFEQNVLSADIEWMVKKNSNRAVDLGAGTGNITLKLLEHGLKVTAVDISRSLLDVLTTEALPYSKKCKIICQDIDSFLNVQDVLPCVVTMSSVLHHLPDPLKTLGLICDLMPSEGILYITHEPTGRTPSLFFRLLNLGEKIIWNLLHPRLCAQARSINYSISDYHSINGFDPEDIKNFFTSKGLNIIKSRLYGSYRVAWLSQIASALGNESQFTIMAQKV